MPWTIAQVEELVAKGRISYSSTPQKIRRCVELQLPNIRPYGIHIPEGVPAPKTIEEAWQLKQKYPMVYGPFYPGDWKVVASFESLGPRCVRLVDPELGVCYVRLQPHAPVPRTAEELKQMADEKTGHLAPQGEIVGEIRAASH